MPGLSYILSGMSSKEKIDFDDMEYMENLLGRDMVFNGLDCYSILHECLKYSGDKYIDLENGKSHVKEKPFRSRLQLLKKQKNLGIPATDSKSKYCSGEAISVDVQLLYPLVYLYYEELLGEGYQVSMSGTDGFVVDPNSTVLAMGKQDNRKEGVYDFLDFIYSPSVYERYFCYDGFPVLESGWDYWKAILTKDSFYDSAGQLVRAYDFEMGSNENKRIIKTGTYSLEQYEKMRMNINNAEYLKPLPQKYVDIVMEEAKMYFEGGKALDDTLDIIENKIYMCLEE